MFTGIVAFQGQVLTNTEGALGNRLVIRAEGLDWQVGESIAVNGVCLTLLPDITQGLMFDVSPETLAVTCLGTLVEHDTVNLERAMLASSRFGGHYVSGHVDTTAIIRRSTMMDEFCEIVIGGFAACDMMCLLPKGSITLDGVSLTINTVQDDAIGVLLVPHTLANTTLGQRAVGERVNVEFDYLTRIVAHQLGHLAKSGHIQTEVLR